MIPSDHFVRFYNEVFKFLDKRNDLAKYYDTISRHQETHCLAELRDKGLRGVYDYYIKIRREENCDLDIELTDHCIMLKMNKCPSLSKAVDNDAGVCVKYCAHCPGWTMPVYTKAGLFQVFHVMPPDVPQCIEWIYDDKALAEEKYNSLAKTVPASELLRNW